MTQRFAPAGPPQPLGQLPMPRGVTVQWEAIGPTDVVGYREPGGAIGERATLVFRWRWLAAFVSGLVFGGIGWLLSSSTGFAWVFLAVGGVAVAIGIYRSGQRTVLVVDGGGVTLSFALPFCSPRRLAWADFGKILVIEELSDHGTLFAVVIEPTDGRRLKILGQLWRHRSGEAVADVIRSVASHFQPND